jgi:predicted SnoaL-like aldol condensation-catalyzing enzyme
MLREPALTNHFRNAAFNRCEQDALNRYWSPDYIQHSAHIPPGREGLRGLIQALPPDLKYENQLTISNGDYVMLHGRFSNIGLPVNWVVVDTFCSWLAMAGASIKEIQELAGHKTITMSARYSHLSPEHRLSVIDRIASASSNASIPQ